MRKDAVARLAHGCAIAEIVDSGLYGRMREVELLEARIERLEQYHCEHEFSKREKGCMESIFCSKCGALHPDWVAGTPGAYYFVLPNDSLHIGGCYYWPKPKEEE